MLIFPRSRYGTKRWYIVDHKERFVWFQMTGRQTMMDSDIEFIRTLFPAADIQLTDDPEENKPL